MMHEKVARLRQLMSEAVPEAANGGSQAEAEIRARFHLYDFNTSHAPMVDTSPRAKAERHIERIASWYAWGAGEIVRCLDDHGAASLQGLSDEAIDNLLARMKRLEECVREGLDSPDAPPAR